MNPPENKPTLDAIHQAMQVLEAQRAVLGEAAVEAALAALHQQAAMLAPAASDKLVASNAISNIQVKQGKLFARIVNNYPKTQTQTAYAEALTAYLRHLLTSYATLNLRGIRTERLLTIELEQVYVSLSTLDPWQEQALLRQQDRLDKATLVELEPQHTRPVQELLSTEKRLAVLGAPGSGKTTLLAYLALTCARAVAEEKPKLAAERLGLPGNDIPLPIFLPLREFAAYLRGLPDTRRVGGGAPSLLLDYLSGYFGRWELHLPTDFFIRQLEAGCCLLLFDGLDEVADYAERTRVSEHVTDFVQRFPQNRFVLTSRLRGYTGAARLGTGFITCTVLDFTDKDIERFIVSWTLAVEAALAGGVDNETVRANATRRAAELLQGVLTNERVRVLAVNPLLLTVIALVHQYRAKLPENRAELYNECTEVLLGYWETGKPGEEGKRLARYTGTELSMDAGEKRAIIEPLAFAMHEQGRRELDKSDLLTMLAQQLTERGYKLDKAKIMAENFLEALVLRSGLLREIEVGVYEFLHLTFQEYLAARVLADRTDFDAYAAARANDPWWKEVILLAAAYLGTTGRGRVSQFVQRLLQAAAEGILLAGECLVDVGRLKIQPEVWRRVEKDLLGLIGPLGSPNMMIRVAAAQSLGYMGDPREGITGLPPLLSAVIQGKFLYGEKKKERETAPFQAGVYPVTNAQFEQFRKDKGYEHQKWWSPEGWQWRQGQPRYPWQKQDQPDYWEDRRFNVPNQPVVGVTWYEAEAFCNWLTVLYGRVYRLPSEAEWERQARGQHGRIYPWGNEWQAGAANTSESKIGRTSAVGIFPAGVSPTGAYDCAGNVWEWCADWYDEKKTARVLRGGSWYNYLDDARCAFRYGNIPGSSYDFIGFRVVSPIS